MSMIKSSWWAIYYQYYDRPTTKASKFNIHKRSSRANKGLTRLQHEAVKYTYTK